MVFYKAGKYGKKKYSGELESLRSKAWNIAYMYGYPYIWYQSLVPTPVEGQEGAAVLASVVEMPAEVGRLFNLKEYRTAQAKKLLELLKDCK